MRCSGAQRSWCRWHQLFGTRCRCLVARVFAATALLCSVQWTSALRGGDVLGLMPVHMSHEEQTLSEITARTLQQVDPAADPQNPPCFWAGADCRADVNSLFPDHSLYLDVISHRANASVCLSWTKQAKGNCRLGTYNNSPLRTQADIWIPVFRWNLWR